MQKIIIVVAHWVPRRALRDGGPGRQHPPQHLLPGRRLRLAGHLPLPFLRRKGAIRQTPIGQGRNRARLGKALTFGGEFLGFAVVVAAAAYPVWLAWMTVKALRSPLRQPPPDIAKRDPHRSTGDAVEGGEERAREIRGVDERDLSGAWTSEAGSRLDLGEERQGQRQRAVRVSNGAPLSGAPIDFSWIAMAHLHAVRH